MKIRLKIKTHGQVEMSNGRLAYKISPRETYLLKEIGWATLPSVLFEPSSYAYMVPPPGGETSKPEMEVDVPHRLDEVEKVVLEMHTRGEQFEGKRGLLDIRYYPGRTAPAYRVESWTKEGEFISEDKPAREIPANLHIGCGFWGCSVDFSTKPYRVTGMMPMTFIEEDSWEGWEEAPRRATA